jgi:outer membrane protein
MMRLILAALLLLAPALARAQPSLSELVPNFVGAGVGFVPEYIGSSRTVVGGAPGGRVALGGERFVTLAGPFLEANLVNSAWFHAGPVLNLRFGRTDAHDRAVRALGDINPSLEMGGRISFQHLNTQGIPFRARVGVTLLGDTSGQASGVSILPFGNMWVPLSQDLFVGMGAMARFTTGGHNRTYFGITPQQASASGLPVFTPSSGAAWVTAWPAIAWRFHPNWALGGGVSYTRIVGDSANSPIVRRGSPDQWIGGIGVAYLW